MTIIKQLKKLAHRWDNKLMKRCRKQHHILFNGSCAMNFINFKPIYEQLILDESVVVYVMNSTTDENFYSQFDVPPEAFITKKKARWKKWDLYIVTDFYALQFKRKHKSLFISHGVSQKKSADSDTVFMGGRKLLNYDKISFSSKRLYDEFVVQYGDEARKKSILCGYPRFDQLIQPAINPEYLRHQLGITDQRPIILFAPTWGEYGALNTFGEQIIKSLAQLDAHILIKLHDHAFSSKSFRKNKIDWPKYLDSYKNINNIYDIRYSDPYPYLQIADMMISDYGSIVLEYQLLKKPTVFFSLKKHNDQVVFNKDILSLLEQSCVTISQPEELENAITQSLQETYFADNIHKQELCDHYFINVGSATKTLLSHIHSLIE